MQMKNEWANIFFTFSFRFIQFYFTLPAYAAFTEKSQNINRVRIKDSLEEETNFVDALYFCVMQSLVKFK